MSWQSAPGDLTERQLVSLRRVLARWREHQVEVAAPTLGDDVEVDDVEVVDVEVLRTGRPGVLDVVAEMDGMLAHAVLGLHRPGDELRVLRPVDEPALGMLEDVDGFVVVVDALHDAGSARLLLEVVGGEAIGAPRRKGTAPSPGAVTVLRDDAEVTTLGFDRRVTLSVFPWLRQGPNAGMTLLAGLEDAGFNHLAAPLAFWRRAGRDLGVVQELLTGTSGGWALALTSLRDLFAAGTSPDVAGGDFAPESLALGTMAARMHLALDRAFGRQAGDVTEWSDAVEAMLARDVPGLLDAPSAEHADGTLRRNLAVLREMGLHPPIIRTHGDFHLGRTARADQGWILADCMPGGADPVSGTAVFRSPLADLADMCWSIRHAAVVAAAERGPMTTRSRVGELADAWQVRNRRAFLAAYLAAPGIGSLVPADRRIVHRMIAAFEAARTAIGARLLAPGTLPPAG